MHSNKALLKTFPGSEGNPDDIFKGKKKEKAKYILNKIQIHFLNYQISEWMSSHLQKMQIILQSILIRT